MTQADFASSTAARAANPGSGFDPAAQIHFAISENAEMRLLQIAQAAFTIGELFSGFDMACNEMREEDTGALFHVLSTAIDDALAGRRLVSPPRPPE